MHLPDSNPRAFVYVSGRTPNRWGFMEGGKHLSDHLAQLAPDVRPCTYALAYRPTLSRSDVSHPVDDVI